MPPWLADTQIHRQLLTGYTIRSASSANKHFASWNVSQ